MTPACNSLRFGPLLDIAARSSAGVGPVLRPENQDNFLLIDAHGIAQFLRDQQPQQQLLAGWPTGHVRVAVLDGMGGHGCGREAAEAVVAGLMAMPACTGLEHLSGLLDTLHATLLRTFGSADTPARRPGTTLTMLELPPGKDALLYHVGDSRLYEITPQQASALTIDHVPATAYAIAGVLGEQEWHQQVHDEHRSQISQAFILGNAFVDPAMLSDELFELSAQVLPPFLAHLPDRRPIALRPDASYLLATDGFWSCPDQQRWVARWPAILNRCASADEMVAALFAAIADAPPPMLHSDNLTAIVLRLKGEPKEDDEGALPTHTIDNGAI